MSVKIGLNGFGRIGRYLLRILAHDNELDLAVVNARGSNEALAYLFKYDSVHGTYPGKVTPNDKGFLIDGKQVLITRDQIGEWQWGKLGVQLVVESTGKVKDREGLAQHIACGAQKVVISAPGENVDLTVVMGVNDSSYDPQKHTIISNASCTTNCLAPAALVLHQAFGIAHGLVTTIHSYTMSQRVLDGTSKDWRRGRAAGISMLPTTTGAAKAIALVVPELQGKLDGMAIRVPTPNVSIVDLTCQLNKDVSIEDVNTALRRASETSLRDNMGYSDEPLVSCDYIGSTYGGVVDALSTTVIEKRMAKIIIWYDNEAGFTHQLTRLLRLVSASM